MNAAASAPATLDPTDPRAELQAGHVLRGLSAIAVVIFHSAAGTMFLRTGQQDWVLTYGSVTGRVLEGLQTAVWVFFALSGYLLTRSFLLAFAAERKMPSLKRYAKRRFFRIVPCFWVTALIVLVFYGAQGSDVGQVLALFGFAQTYDRGGLDGLLGHGWTLDVEAMFYVVLPFAAIGSAWLLRRLPAGQRRGLGALALLIAGVIVTWKLGEATDRSDTPMIQSPIQSLRAFLPGLIVAWLHVRYGRLIAGQHRLRWIAPPLAVGGLALLYGTEQWATPGSGGVETIGSLGAGLLLAAIVLWQLTTGRAPRTMAGGPLLWLGERAYPFYLLHGIVVYELRNLGDGQGTARHQLLLYAPAAILVCAAAAAIMHVLIENPGIRLGARGPKKPATSPPAPAAVTG